MPDQSISPAIYRKPSFWLLVGAGVCFAWGWRYVPLLFDPPALIATFDRLGPWKVPVFLAIHILATVFGVPGTVLVLIGGGLFGLWWGSLWSLIGATVGAIAAFAVARYLLQDWFRRRFGRHKYLNRLDQLMDTHSLNCVLAVRFAPLSPFNLVNFLFGLTSVPLSAYALGTLIGIAPGTVAYTWVGLASLEAIEGKGLWHLTWALGCLALLSLAPLWWRRRA
ncbi:MAG: TVP38/TMEM64 family protein [Leptolyngbyaceae cyanobacterium]